MSAESLFCIPCLCGREVKSHYRVTTCPECGRLLVVEWVRPDATAGTEASEEEAGV